ncbi:redoxin domain-containing protein [archaeon]|nr:redoxin domain-containing protein [archaeon]
MINPCLKINFLNGIEFLPSGRYNSVMKKIIRPIIVLLVLFGISSHSEPAFAAEKDFPAAIIKARLKLPDDPAAGAALGIKQKPGTTIALSDIDADIIIIEIFSMYCPFCQRHAPMTNKLYQLIQADSAKKGKVRLIGIGVGNSPYEVKFFKKKYSIEFPLFDDANSAVLNSLQGVKTPHYFAIKKTDKALNVFFMQQGAFDDPESFLKTVMSKSPK